MLLESRYFTTMKATSSKSFFIFLAYLTCCAWAWPAVAPSVYRQNSNANANYIPYTSNVAYEPVDYQLPVDNYNYNGQWERAREPQSYYDLVDDYWMNQPTSDVEVRFHFILMIIKLSKFTIFGYNYNRLIIQGFIFMYFLAKLQFCYKFAALF